VEAQLASARLERREDETLEELDARLAREGHPLSHVLSPVTRRYLEARFGGRPLRQGEAAVLLGTLKRAVADEARRAAAESRAPRARRAS
jgi:hypothetical protein